MQKLNLDYLAYSLDRLCRFLDDIYNINCGGCCLISYFIASNLDKLGVKYNLVIYSDYKKCVSRITKEIVHMSKESKSINSITGRNTCFHYTLKINHGGIINRCSANLEGLEYQIRNIHSENIKWIYDTGDWNKEYNINNSESIKSIINSFFEQFLK